MTLFEIQREVTDLVEHLRFAVMPDGSSRITKERVDRLEELVDEMDAVPPLLALCIPPKATLTIWLIYSQDNSGTYIEGAFTSKPQAEAALRWHEKAGHPGMRHWIRELQTEPHEEPMTC